MLNNCFNCIIPTLTKDYLETRDHLYDMLDMFSIDRLVILGPEKLRHIVEEDAKKRCIHDRISFVNGNDIIPFDSVQAAYDKRLNELSTSGTDTGDASSAGWYYQQFLKMAYCRTCDTDYYLCWDADTIPLRKTDMFSASGEPYLDIKQEYIPSYFDTLNKLFGFNKIIEKSFISGHMLFNKKFMNELIDEIMDSNFDGETFYEKIFNAVEQPHNGFSEFETYGTWVAIRHPGSYRLRNWSSLRNASLIINRTGLTEDDLDWLATGFDAASFERYQDAMPELTGLFRNPEYRSKMTADIFYKTLLESGMFGEYHNEGLIVGDNICPA